ncbi:MAG: glycoside hydrolase family 19 protein [Methylococcaceae bacterium]|nr:glycoside hydrolase family 19 protein [Methylococcaceae bacterium]MDZ4155378.1 glycoside hydrolase family 19 protein [Methylococcales bacterium]MDP2392930.1 glycoside hydrolase family 19 protein [Methylococcaceae bacterium]MDP3018264.1 glycoside hydrolase family 19 protein [Methylococcaceae bacterium]MDP3391004.1 glycoside hydrolase family 19 protein [Methylococcaceae bacterium]
MITAASLKKILPLCKEPGKWANALNPAMDKYGINTPVRIASFLAQTGHESGQFNKLIENLTYKTPARLVKIWPKRFPTEASAIPYVNNEEKLANFVYSKRIGNGDVDSGDGYRYRGRGIIQVTGKSNYAEIGKAIGVDLLKNPDLLTTPELAALSAAYYWQGHGLNALADDGTGDDDLEDFTAITKKINGGTEGLAQRLALFKSIQETLIA